MQDTITIENETIILNGFSEVHEEITFNLLPNSVTIIPGVYVSTFAYHFPVSIVNGKKIVVVDEVVAKRLKPIEGAPMLFHNGTYYPLPE